MIIILLMPARSCFQREPFRGLAKASPMLPPAALILSSSDVIQFIAFGHMPRSAFSLLFLAVLSISLVRDFLNGSSKIPVFLNHILHYQ